MSSPIPQWLVASSVLLFAGLGVALSVRGVGVVGFVVAFVVAAFGVTGIFTAIGWRRGRRDAADPLPGRQRTPGLGGTFPHTGARGRAVARVASPVRS